MRRLTKLVWALLALHALGLELPLEAASEDVEALVRKGVRLHEEGLFDTAVATFEQALQLAPDDPLVCYELGLTLSAKGDQAGCIATAERGLKSESRLSPALYTLAGNCLDLAGEAKQAIKMYQRGLRKFPHQSPLLFNLAVAQMRRGKQAKAVTILGRAIAETPRYASAYRMLMFLHRDQQERLATLLCALRFLSLEAEGPRAEQVASQMVAALELGIERQSSSEVRLTFDIETAADDMLISMAAVAAEAAGEATPDAMRRASGLQGVLRMFNEGAFDGRVLSSPTVDRELRSFFADLGAAGLVETLTYWVLSPLQLEGGEEWSAAHVEEVSRLHTWLAGWESDR